MIFSVLKKIWVFGYSWSTLLWYRCYYPRRSRDALSPVCGIFLLDKVMGICLVERAGEMSGHVLLGHDRYGRMSDIMSG